MQYKLAVISERDSALNQKEEELLKSLKENQAFQLTAVKI